MVTTTLLIAGASVRAAVGSARRSGAYRLLAADLFNDRDLRQTCESRQVDSGYDGLAQLAADERPDFWMYTGALENHPAVIAAVSRHARLLGNDAALVERIRQPSQFTRALTACGLPCPDLRTDACPHDGDWLRKPVRSAAGTGIRPALPGDVNHAGDVYFQRRVQGSSCSAVFVACQGSAQWLGATQQLSGDESFGATGYQYCGSVGPLPMTELIRQQWERVGNCLASTFELKGLFGVDAIVRDEQVVPVEINPRYTASIEVLETGQTWSSIDLHFAACQGERAACEPGPPESYAGKAIVLARKKSIVSGALLDWIDQQNETVDAPSIADIPHVNTSIGAGQPVATVLARSDTFDAVLPLLRQRAADVAARLA